MEQECYWLVALYPGAGLGLRDTTTYVERVPTMFQPRLNWMVSLGF